MGAAHVNASSHTCPACLAQRPSASVAWPGRGGVDGWWTAPGLRQSPPFERVARHRLARKLPCVLINKWQGGAAPAGGAQLPRWGRVRAVERAARNRQTGEAQPPADWGVFASPACGGLARHRFSPRNWRPINPSALPAMAARQGCWPTARSPLPRGKPSGWGMCRRHVPQ